MICSAKEMSMVVIMLLTLFLYELPASIYIYFNKSNFNPKRYTTIQCKLTTGIKFGSCNYLFTKYLSSINKTFEEDEPIGYNVIIRCDSILDIKADGNILYDVMILDDGIEIKFPQSFWGFKINDSSYIIYECHEFWRQVCDPFYDLYKVTVTKQGRFEVERLIDIDHVHYCKNRLKRLIINMLEPYKNIEFHDVYDYLYYTDSICDVSDTMCKYNFDTNVYLYSFWQAVVVCDNRVFDSIYYTLKLRYSKIWDGMYAAYIDNLKLKYKLYCDH